jgi:hypothetical protein
MTRLERAEAHRGAGEEPAQGRPRQARSRVGSTRGRFPAPSAPKVLLTAAPACGAYRLRPRAAPRPTAPGARGFPAAARGRRGAEPRRDEPYSLQPRAHRPETLNSPAGGIGYHAPKPPERKGRGEGPHAYEMGARTPPELPGDVRALQGLRVRRHVARPSGRELARGASCTAPPRAARQPRP